MSRYLVDTNIISEAARRQPSPAISAWLERQSADDLFISSFTIGEILRGILDLPIGRKRAVLEAWFSGPRGPRAMFSERILHFDERAALEWGRLMSDGRSIGRPRSPIDMIIAATALANDCVVVTANERDFVGAVQCLNPARLAE